MSEDITWDKAKKEFGLRMDFELLKLFPKGLQPYSYTNEGVERIGCPYEYHAHALKVAEWREVVRKLEEHGDVDTTEKTIPEIAYGQFDKEIQDMISKDPNLQEPNGGLNRLSWEFYRHPSTNEEVGNVLDYLKERNAHFKQEEVEKIKIRFVEDPLIRNARKEIQKIWEYLKKKLQIRNPL